MVSWLQVELIFHLRPVSRLADEKSLGSRTGERKQSSLPDMKKHFAARGCLIRILAAISRPEPVKTG